MAFQLRNCIFSGYRIGRLVPIYHSRHFLSDNVLKEHHFPSGTNIIQRIGKREIVGHGKNSEPSYIDNPAFPFPAIRFKECSLEILSLRIKEQGDWNELTIREKKKLYRASFCQTFAEMNAQSPIWKSIIGWALIWISVGIWVFLYLQYIWHTELPDSFSQERQKAQLKRILALEINPILGISSKWDYECKTWK